MNAPRMCLAWLFAFMIADIQTAVAADDVANPCAGRPPTFQVFEGSCLPDRLVGYLKCVEKTGGNRLKVSKDDASKTGSDVRVEVEGKGEGIVVKGAGKVAVGRKKVDETIKKLDEIYGDRATEICLVAAGLKADKPAPRQKPKVTAPPQPSAPATKPSAATSGGTPAGIHQDVKTGSVAAADNSTVVAGSVQGAGRKDVDQKVEVGGPIKAKGGSKVEIGTVKE